MNSLEEKKQQFESFFLIKHPTKVNISIVDSKLALQTMDEFERDMPYAFRIASELSEIESQALKPLRSMGEKLEELVNYLQLQARKIDLMMSYILIKEDEEEKRAEALKFGGGGIVVSHSKPVEVGAVAEVKIFLEQEAAAIYCLAEAIELEVIDDLYQVSYVYTHIRDQDQELLVRASLHLQTSQLRKSR
ncbi:PilZ domain-containing protein [Glaciecola sp. MF2-115]|uniref:PilZ domain-containing protein n=1 Tax=Glaciecola sp. MF2-115 TaxID=3384827 RepID=UPI0039A283B4